MFKILGADGKEYGPVTTDQLKQWMAEGRANLDTMVQREGETGWRPLSQFPEFAAAFTPQPLGTAAPAFSPSGADPGSRARAAQMVSAPAICLIVAAALGIAYALLGIVMHLLGVGMMGMGQQGNIPPELEKMVKLISGGLGIVFSVLGILIGLFIIYAALQMKQLRSHGVAFTASILSMIPCLSPCCWLGLPFGIWALVVLSKPEVKSQFE